MVIKWMNCLFFKFNVHVDQQPPWRWAAGGDEPVSFMSSPLPRLNKEWVSWTLGNNPPLPGFFLIAATATGSLSQQRSCYCITELIRIQSRDRGALQPEPWNQSGDRQMQPGSGRLLCQKMMQSRWSFQWQCFFLQERFVGGQILFLKHKWP